MALCYRKLGRITVVFILGSGCLEDKNLPVPPAAVSEGSMVLVHELDGRVQSVFASQLSSPEYPLIPRSSSSRLYSAQYACGISNLGLPLGDVELLPEPQTGAWTPSPEAIYGLEIEKRESSVWNELESVPPIVTDTLARLPIPQDRLCDIVSARYEPVTVDAYMGSLFVLEVPTLVLPLGGRDFLLSTRIFDVQRELPVGYANQRLVEEVIEFPEELDQLGPILHGYRRADGDLVLMGAEDWMVGHPDRGFTVIASFPANTAPLSGRISGPIEGPLDELYAIIDNGDELQLVRYDGNGFEILQTDRTSATPYADYSVVWLSPGEFMARGLSEPRGDVIHYKDGNFMTETVSTRSLVSLASVEGWGTLATDTSNRVFIRAEEQWAPIRELAFRTPVSFFSNEPPGLWMAGSLGADTYYPTSQLGECDQVVLPPQDFPEYGGPDAEGNYVSVSVEANELTLEITIKVTLFRRVRAFDDCGLTDLTPD